jgi:hypothetical protein
LLGYKSQNTTTFASEPSADKKEFLGPHDHDFNFELADVHSLQDYLRFESMARAEMASLVRQGKANFSTSHIVYLIKKKQGLVSEQNTLIFADLACSEKIRKSVYLGEKLLETNEKTSNLIYFSKCINYLLESKRKQIVRKEDCLVDLLYEALGGNSMTCYLISVSLREEDKDLTFNTLEFAQKVSSIENFLALPNDFRSQVPSSTKVDDQIQHSSGLNQSSKKDSLLLPSWLAKCNDLLNENGSEMKRLQTRNLDLESQVIKLEKMLMMSNIDFSSASKDSPGKNLSFFSIENDLCLNNILYEEEALPTNPRVSFSKHNEHGDLSCHHEGHNGHRCQQCMNHEIEKSNLKEQIQAQKSTLNGKISSLEEEIATLKAELASKTSSINHLTESNNALLQERQLSKASQAQLEDFWKNRCDQIMKVNSDLELLIGQLKQRETLSAGEVAQVQNSRLQLQVELQQTQSHLKISLQNEKLLQAELKRMEEENRTLKENHRALSWKHERLQAEHSQLVMVNNSQAEEYNRVLNMIRELENEKELLNFKKNSPQTRGILRSTKEPNAGKTITQLRLELKSQTASSRKSIQSENKENELSILNDSNWKNASSKLGDEELEYLSLPINFRTSVTAYPTYRETSEKQPKQLAESNWGRDSLLAKLDFVKAVTPLKKPAVILNTSLDYRTEDVPLSEPRFQSASLAKASEKKKEICDLLDLLSNYQKTIEAKLKNNELQDSDFSSANLRLDLVRLWREMEHCLKAENQMPNPASQLEFLQEMLLKIFNLVDLLIISRDKIAKSHREIFRDKSEYQGIVRCQAKFITDLNIDEDLLELKREKFLKCRRAVAKISKYYKIHRLKLETGKLKRMTKTNHQMFQAGSGKFLLQSLMNCTENFFLQTLEKLRPDVQVSLDKRTSQWVALARLQSLESSS